MNDPTRSAELRRLVAARQDQPGATLPVLHDIQAALGHIPAEAIPLIAEAFQLSRAEVHGVVSYYHHFRQQPPGRHVLRICRAEACQSVGGEALLEHAQQALGCGLHETSGDDAVTLEPVYCLGQCACGPNLMIDDETLQARVTPERFDRLLETLREAS